jgi:hypothetical protein
MQDHLVQGSFIPCNVAEQYQFEEQHGLREIDNHEEQKSHQLHLFLDMVVSQMKVSFLFTLLSFYCFFPLVDPISFQILFRYLEERSRFHY